VNFICHGRPLRHDRLRWPPVALCSTAVHGASSFGWLLFQMLYGWELMVVSDNKSAAAPHDCCEPSRTHAPHASSHLVF
jgi:hypothetical protein